MNDAGKSVLDALMRGMEIEKETFDYYTRAEQKTFDPEAKRIFRWLAKSEEVHYLKLTELYNALNEGGSWVFYGGSTIVLDPQGTEITVGYETGVLEALQFAKSIEQKAINYFNDLLSETTGPEGRVMVETLRDEEEEHLRIITNKWRSIMLEQVKAALEIVRPALKADGGDVELVEVTDTGVVKVKLKGACGHCPMSTMTLKMGIEKTLKEKVPGVTEVVAA